MIAAVVLAVLSLNAALDRAVTVSPDVTQARERVREQSALLAAARASISPAITANYAQAPQAGSNNETIAQRLVRAKRKIREAHIPFTVPAPAQLPDRLSDVLRVLYLIFNEGYASSTHAQRVRTDLCDEALRLVRLVDELMPGEPEIAGLHALILFHDARRDTRIDEFGDLVLLQDQDRTKWDARKILRGITILDGALRHKNLGTYQIEAALASEHARAATWEETNWFAIREWYDRLMEIAPSPVVALNRAVAIAYTDGNAAGLSAMDDAARSGELADYPSLYVARAELLRRLGRLADAKAQYARANELTQSDAERRHIEKHAQNLQ